MQRRFALIHDFDGPSRCRHVVRARGNAPRELPLADLLYLEVDTSSAMLFRYTRASEFGGDTWHETPEDAYDQATFEYGDALGPWEDVPEEAQDGRAFAVAYANRDRGGGPR